VFDFIPWMNCRGGWRNPVGGRFAYDVDEVSAAVTETAPELERLGSGGFFTYD